MSGAVPSPTHGRGLARDAGSFTAWFIGNVDKELASKRKAKKIENMLTKAMQSDSMPSLACFIGGDAPMQQSQGRVVRWDRENLQRGDRAIARSRRMLKEKHKAEVAARKSQGLDGLVHRIELPQRGEDVIKSSL